MIDSKNHHFTKTITIDSLVHSFRVYCSVCMHINQCVQSLHHLQNNLLDSLKRLSWNHQVEQ